MRRPSSALGLLVLAAGAYALALRPRLLRSGATDDELRVPSPGWDIIPGAKLGSTMATTIDAPPSEIWPWLVQMGCDRAGWYSWDLLDNGGRPSARDIHPEWQSLAVGERIWSTPDHKHWFEVAALEPERLLALRAAMTPSGRQFDSREPRPRAFTDALWAFHLEPLPGERTRLIVTTHSASAPTLPLAMMNLLFWEPAHWIMQRRQFTNLKRRVEEERARRAVEGAEARAANQPIAPNGAPLPGV